MGGSYGGYATLAGLDLHAGGVLLRRRHRRALQPGDAAGDHPALLGGVLRERCAAASAIRGPSRASKLLRERSPLNFAGDIAKPLLIGQGANDPRVKQAESDQIIAAMRAKGLPVTYVLYPEEGHGFAVPENRMSFQAIAEAFLVAHLGGRPSRSARTSRVPSSRCAKARGHVPGLEAALAARAGRLIWTAAWRGTRGRDGEVRPLPLDRHHSVAAYAAALLMWAQGPVRRIGQGKTGDAMDSNVARASAVTCSPPGWRVAGSRSCTTLSSSTGGQDRHGRRQLPICANSPSSTRTSSSAYGVEMEIRRNTRVKDKEGKSTSNAEGRLTLRALTDDNSGITAAFVKGGLVGSLQGRLASEKQKGRHAEYSQLRSVGRLFYEPVWVFTRGDMPIETLRDLKGKKIISARATAALAASPRSCCGQRHHREGERHLHRRGPARRCRASDERAGRCGHPGDGGRHRQDAELLQRARYPPDGLQAARRRPTPIASRR